MTIVAAVRHAAEVGAAAAAHRAATMTAAMTTIAAMTAVTTIVATTVGTTVTTIVDTIVDTPFPGASFPGASEGWRHRGIQGPLATRGLKRCSSRR